MSEMIEIQQTDIQKIHISALSKYFCRVLTSLNFKSRFKDFLANFLIGFRGSEYKPSVTVASF